MISAHIAFNRTSAALGCATLKVRYFGSGTHDLSQFPEADYCLKHLSDDFDPELMLLNFYWKSLIHHGK